MFRHIPRLLLLLAVIAFMGCGLPTTSTPTSTVLAPTAPPTAPLAPSTMTRATVPATSLPTPTPTTPAIASHLTSVPQPSATSIPIVTPAVEWVDKQFDSVWRITYPKGWAVNEGGVYEGHIDMRGTYDGHQYEIWFSYPIFDQPVDSLDAWISQTLERLSEHQRAEVTISDITVAGTPAKKLRNVPEEAVGKVSHQAYIWRTGDKNPRWMMIRQIDNQATDLRQMERLFDQFLAGVG